MVGTVGTQMEACMRESRVSRQRHIWYDAENNGHWNLNSLLLMRRGRPARPTAMPAKMIIKWDEWISWHKSTRAYLWLIGAWLGLWSAVYQRSRTGRGFLRREDVSPDGDWLARPPTTSQSNDTKEFPLGQYYWLMARAWSIEITHICTWEGSEKTSCEAKTSVVFAF